VTQQKVLFKTVKKKLDGKIFFNDIFFK
jgi:hypothetical protein